MTDKFDKIDQKMKQLQEKYSDWFNSDENNFGDIEYHYALNSSSDKITFGFRPHSNLPDFIRSECSVVVDEILSK